MHNEIYDLEDLMDEVEFHLHHLIPIYLERLEEMDEIDGIDLYYRDEQGVQDELLLNDLIIIRFYRFLICWL